MKSETFAFLVFSIILLVAGCSDPKSSIFDPDSGQHKTAWLPGEHSLAVTIGTSSVGAPVYSTAQCIECHGSDLTGGISGVSCTSCHLGGPTAVHPADWNGTIMAKHKAYVIANTSSNCANTYCHGSSLNGVTGSGPSCSSCHIGGATSVHPLNWDPIYLTHGPSVSTGVTGTALCANQYCHGTTLTGVANSGPSCDKNAGIGGCHSIPYDPLTVTCGACHRIPPGGTKFPDLAGKHGKHATSNTTSCNICHNGASSYVGDHRNNVINFSFLPAYTPNTGLTPSFNASTKTCSNISCHGGQTTPSWYTGSIDVNSQCTSCHAYGTTQYNGFRSGFHDTHIRFDCTECHDTLKLASVHFNDLDTTAMNQAYLTINEGIQTGGLCTLTCHGEYHDMYAW